MAMRAGSGDELLVRDGHVGDEDREGVIVESTGRRSRGALSVRGGGEAISARRIGNVPAWVFHGAKDPVVPLKRSEDMVEALKRVNKEVKFTVYPDAQHDSWTETYNNPELYEWLLAQKRGVADAAK